jgi:hypothetical protein
MSQEINPSTDQDHTQPSSAEAEDPATKQAPSETADEPSLVDVALQSSIKDEIDQSDQIRVFLPAAKKELYAKVRKVAKQLVSDSVNAAAARRGATAVDRGDVKHACEQLSGGSRERNSWLLCIASAVGGGAIAGLIAVLLTPPPSHQVVWGLAIAIAGAAALVLLLLTYPRKS